MSPARRSYERKIAEKRAQDRPASARQAARLAETASDYELKRAEVGEDIARLKEIQSIEAKIALKRELLPKYDSWVEGVLAADAEVEPEAIDQDDILVHTMIWAIDCADASRAVPRARTVIRHGMSLPSRFERTTGCMIAEEFAEVALAALRDENHVPELEPLLEIEELTADEDMPDQARAKLQKAIAYVILRRSDAAADADAADQGTAGGIKAALEAAMGNMKRALQLDSKVGVKKELEIRGRQLRDLSDADE